MYNIRLVGSSALLSLVRKVRLRVRTCVSSRRRTISSVLQGPLVRDFSKYFTKRLPLLKVKKKLTNNTLYCSHSFPRFIHALILFLSITFVDIAPPSQEST